MNANSRPTRVIRRKRERPEPETFVFWDIVSCPVPNGHDARLVGPSIKSALNDGGYTHPITITAIGFLPYTENQTRTLYDLPELTATGINVIYVPKGYNEIMDYVRNWTWFHPRPATILFITGAVIHKYFYSSVSKLHDNGYTILHAYPGAKSTETKSVKSTFSWESIILQATSLTSVETRPGTYLCSLCVCGCLSFESFTHHLQSEDHITCMLSIVESPFCTNKKRMTAYDYSIAPPRSKESIEEEEAEEARLAIETQNELRTEEWDRITI